MGPLIAQTGRLWEPKCRQASTSLSLIDLQYSAGRSAVFALIESHQQVPGIAVLPQDVGHVCGHPTLSLCLAVAGCDLFVLQ